MLKCAVIGNLGNDAEMRYSATGQAMLSFNVAANYRAKNASGEWDDLTEWVRCSVFGTRAEAMSNRLTKGARVYVDGRLQARPWVDRKSEPRAGLEILADSVEFMSTREGREPSVPAAHAPRQQPVAAGNATADDLDGLPF